MAGLPVAVVDRAEKIVQMCHDKQMFDTNTDAQTFLEIVKALQGNDEEELKNLINFL